MEKHCYNCNNEIDISQVESHLLRIIQFNNLLCSNCSNKKTSYKCNGCNKILNQNTIGSMTIYGFAIKSDKICLDCNIQMIESI